MNLDKYINELNKIKEKYGGDIELARYSSSIETLNEIVSINSVGRIMNVKKTKKTFKDDFDGTYFKIEVYEPCKKEESEKILIL